MDYSRSISVNNPGCVLIMVDQSGSMDELSFTAAPGANGAVSPRRSRAQVAAAAANELLYELMEACQAGSMIKDRFMVGVIGYGAEICVVCLGMISSVAEQAVRVAQSWVTFDDGAGGNIEMEVSLPVWVEPAARNGSPMAQAFAEVRRVLSNRWLAEHPDSFPPMVINITDGEPDDADAVRMEAARLRELQTGDGNVLLFNCYIPRKPVLDLVFPWALEQVPGEEARFLYQISSPLPPSMCQEAEKLGIMLSPGARGFMMEHSPRFLPRLLRTASQGL